MSDYPEHDKLSAVQTQSQAIGEFLDALSEESIVLCRHQDHRKERYGEGPEDYIYAPSGYYPIRTSVQQLLAEHFGIDLETLEAEKRKMLDDIRSHVFQSKEQQPCPHR